MNVLVTGANGFVGKNLTQRLSTIKDHRDRTRPVLQIEEILSCTRDTSAETLADYCKKANFVVHLAGVNRPQDPGEFTAGNTDFTRTLLEMLRESGNRCPVLLSSSIQASLTGRYAGSPYGQSKKAVEELLLAYGEETGAGGMIYRLPNLFGKWCRPNYNSAIATFCNNIANDLPIQVNDRSVEMELLYIDDLVDEMIGALTGNEHRCDYDGLTPIPHFSPSLNNSSSSLIPNSCKYCFVPVTHKTTLGEIVDIINECADAAANKDGINMIELPQGSLRYKLMSTYLSYLPKEKAIYDHKMNVDARGSFTELLHTLTHGQVSINISKPGITKGEHWHHSKFEYFTVVSGHGLIQLRNEADPNAEILNYEVSGDKIQSVIMLPGYTHNIINLSDTEDLVTVMYCNEIFNPQRPDTYFDPVNKN